MVATALWAALCAAHAQDAKERASNAAIVDGAAAAARVVSGAADLNPVGPIVGIGVTTAVFHYAAQLPEAEQPSAYAFAASVWHGTAANNLCLTAAVLTGGSFSPVCIALGLAWGMKTWTDSEHERRFWERCALLREFSDRPDLPCVYVPPPQEPVLEAGGTTLASHEIEAP